MTAKNMLYRRIVRKPDYPKLQRMAPLRPYSEASKEWEPIPRFRQAVVDVAYYLRRWKMWEGESTPPPQELRTCIAASQLELRAAATGTWLGPPAGPNGMTPEIIKQLKLHNIGILALFKEKHFDATPVFRFIHDAMSLSSDLEERDCLAALDNLELQTTDNLPAIVVPELHEKAMLILPLLSNTVFKKIGTLTMDAKAKDICTNRDTVSKYIDQLVGAGLAEKNTAGNVRALPHSA